MIDIRLVNDLETAKKIWEKLSLQESLYDLWDVRYCLYKKNPHPFYFYVAYDNEQPVALLPLTYNEKKNYLEFMAESFIEDNRLFFSPGYEYLLADFFKINFPHPVRVYDLMGDSNLITDLPLEDYVYVADVSDCSNFDEYLIKYFPDRHRRHNFKAIFKNLEKRHELKIVYDDFSDLGNLFDLNVKNFAGESYLRTKAERQSFTDLIALELDWSMVTILVDGSKLAISLSVTYQNVYYYFISGADNSEVKDIFKYLTKVNIEQAIEKGVKVFNSSLGDCNWKQYWHFDKLSRYKFEKNT